MAETKRERFKRLASLRTNEAIRRIKILSNCSNRSAYEYSEEDINRIFAELEKRMKEARSKFHFTQKNKRFEL